jgi:hypothetical protein
MIPVYHRPVMRYFANGAGPKRGHFDGKKEGNQGMSRSPLRMGQVAQVTIGARADGSDGWRGAVEALAIYDKEICTGRDLAVAQAHYKALAADLAVRAALLPLVVHARLEEISPLTAARGMTIDKTYPRLLGLARYTVQRVVSGRYDETSLAVMHWAMLDAKPVPAYTARQPGTVYELTLEPLDEDTHPELVGDRRIETPEVDLNLPVFLDVGPTTAPARPGADDPPGGSSGSAGTEAGRLGGNRS